jgi:hypothetical protein
MIIAPPPPPSPPVISWLQCDLRGTEQSSQGVINTALTLTYRIDDTHHILSFSARGAPFRDIAASGWRVETWTPELIVLRADRGVTTLDRAHLGLTTHVVEHKAGLTIDQNATARCRRLEKPPAG